MDFSEQLKSLATRIPSLMVAVKTEEGTKNALIMPFIQILGYNVFDPTEVCPECIADCGTKKGEKVDYAIMQDGKPAILIECKSADVNLSDIHLSQLFRYFAVTDANVGILTNGVTYQFFADLDEANKMDTKPFLEINMQNLTDVQIAALSKFRKGSFDVETVLPSAIEMKYTREIKRILGEQLEVPDENLVRYFAKQITTHTKLTQKALEELNPIVKRALNQFINDKINERLQSAMAPQEKPVEKGISTPDEIVDAEEDKIATTDEELKGFYMIQAILSDVVDPSRVVMRDVQSYCGILLDNTNRKPLCRMYFNSPTKKYLGFFDGDKETKEILSALQDIYKYSERLRATARKYDMKT